MQEYVEARTSPLRRPTVLTPGDQRVVFARALSLFSRVVYYGISHVWGNYVRLRVSVGAAGELRDKMTLERKREIEKAFATRGFDVVRRCRLRLRDQRACKYTVRLGTVSLQFAGLDGAHQCYNGTRESVPKRLNVSVLFSSALITLFLISMLPPLE